MKIIGKFLSAGDLITGLTSTFLHIHPKGASVDYIWSYIQQFDKDIRPLDVESMLNQ